MGILDEDKSGTVTSAEFVEQLHKMKTQESHTLLVFIKHYVNEIREKVTDQLALIEDDILTKMDDHEQRVSELLAIAKDPNIGKQMSLIPKSPSHRRARSLSSPSSASVGSRPHPSKGRFV